MNAMLFFGCFFFFLQKQKFSLNKPLFIKYIRRKRRSILCPIQTCITIESNKHLSFVKDKLIRKSYQIVW